MPRRKGKRSTSGEGSHREHSTKGRGPVAINGDCRRRGRGASSSSLFLPDDVSAFVILSAVTAVAYSPVFRAGFVWDDSIITDSEQVQSWSGVYDLWFRPSNLRSELHYWPMVYTTFWLEYHLWGFEPLGYHVVNLGLHVINSYLVRRLLGKLGASDAASWLAASVFALHPTRVESVAWVIERKDVLSGLFYLLALLWHPTVSIDDKGKNGPRELGDIWVSLGYYVLGMLSKTIVVSLPVALLLIPWMMRGTLSSVEINRSVPFFAVGVVMALFDMRMAREGEPVDFGFSLLQRIFIAARALCFYLVQLAWPSKLMVIYPLWKFDKDREIWAGCFLFVMAASVTALSVFVRTWPIIGNSCDHSRMWLRIPAAAFICFGATLFPVLCVIDYGYMKYSYVADRFAYLAAIAPIGLFTVTLLRGCERLFPASSTSPQGGSIGSVNLVLLFTGTALLAILASLTHQHASIYANEETFYSHIVSLNPVAHNMMYNLGNVYMRQDRNAEAAECYENAFQQDPSADKLHTNYGVVLSRLGRTEEAVKVLKKGLESEKKRSGSRKTNLNELGNTMSRLNKYDEAVKYFEQALSIDPNYAIGWNNLGNVYMRQDRNAEAVECYEKAVQQDPSYDKLYSNYGTALSKVGRTEEAVKMFKKGLESEEKSSGSRFRILNELGGAMSRLKQYNEAVKYYEQALSIDPNYAIGWFNMANDLLRGGRAIEAVTAYRRAFEINPNYNRARVNCAIALGSLKRHSEQVSLLQEVIRRDPENIDAKQRLDAALTEIN